MQSPQPARGYQVHLSVYDLHKANDYGYYVGIGAFHSGVVIDGREYAFGGHSGSGTGVYDIMPRSQTGALFRESIFMGECKMRWEEIRRVIDELSTSFTGESYNPVTKNCNSFSNELCLRLLKRSIPGWINRLAWFGSFIGSDALGLTTPSAPTSAPAPSFVPFAGSGTLLSADNPSRATPPGSDAERREVLAKAALKRLETQHSST